MYEWSKSVPSGMKDYLFGDAAKRRRLEGDISEVLECRGYHEVITPVLEFYDVFSECAGAFKQEDMYKMFDADGRILVLRHDMTTPIARVVTTKLKDAFYPLKFYYKQSVVRSNGAFRGKRDEVAQCGAELIGEEGVRADLEIIASAIESMRACVKDSFRIELGHIGFYEAAAQQLAGYNCDLDGIRDGLADNDFAALDELLKGLPPDNTGVKMIKSLPRLFGDISVLEKAREISNDCADGVIDKLELLYYMLKELGYDKYISFDLGVVHNINYYTGLVFRGYVEGAGDACLNGGRYDRLMERFGPQMPAVGFAVNLDSVAETAQGTNCDLSPDIVIHYDDGCERRAYELLKKYAAQGLICEISVFDSPEKSYKYAVKRNTRQRFIHISEKEEIVTDMEVKSL